MKIHACSELVNNTETNIDDECMNQISTIFGKPRWRGSGVSAFVIELDMPDNEIMAVKVTGRNDNELRIACILNSIEEETRIFPHTHGWLLCKSIPEMWLEIMRENDIPDLWTSNNGGIPRTVMFLFIQLADATLEDVSLQHDHGYRTVIFLLFHGLYVAHAKLGFRHNDLHGGNIMLQLRGERTCVHYGEYEVEVTSEYAPYVIDYGLASTIEHHRDYHADDLGYVLEAFSKHMQRTGLREVDPERIAFDNFMEEVNRDRNPNTEIEWLPLLDNAYFDVPEIRRYRPKRRALGKYIQHIICSNCGYVPLFPQQCGGTCSNKKAIYCGTECQLKHWMAGHQKECGKKK